MTEIQSPVFPISKYLLQFLGISVLLSIVMFAFIKLTGIDPPSSSGIIALIATLAAIAPGIAKTIRRELTKAERAAFALWSSLLSIAVSATTLLLSLVLAGVPLTSEGIGTVFGSADFSPAVLAAVAAIAFAVSWVVTYFTLGFLVKGQLKRLQSAAKQ